MVNLQTKDSKGNWQIVEVKFSSFWGAWFLAYLATIGVAFGIGLFIGVVVGLFGG